MADYHLKYIESQDDETILRQYTSGKFSGVLSNIPFINGVTIEHLNDNHISDEYHLTAWILE